MRKLFIAMIAGGFLLLSGVVASARFDSGSSSQAPQIQTEGSGSGAQGDQTGNSQTTDKATKLATKPATKPTTKPATKPAATTGTNSQCGFEGEFEGEQNDDSAACNVQEGQAGVNEKTDANDKAEKNGNNED
jgi:hypothetical protein